MSGPVEDFRVAATADPGGCLLAVDFDGTLAGIVDDPSTAVPVDGALEVLVRAADRWGEVAVLSGRPRSFLEDRIPDPAVTLVGLYGLEVRRRGERSDHPELDRWRAEVVRAVGLAAPLLPAGVGVESKGSSLTLHYRTCPEHAPRVAEVAEQVAADTGLVVRTARMSVELHPPVEVDKGTVLGELAAGSGGPVCVAGDDRGDVPAFGVLRDLRVLGRVTLAVAVVGPETPSRLAELADVAVDGPAGVVELLDGLLG